MTRRLVLAMTALVALVAIALAVPLSAIVDADEREAFIARLEIDALSTASILASQPDRDWPTTALAVSERTGARVVVVDTNRRLVADSDLSDLDRSFDRAEIDEALEGYLASDVRYSNTLALTLRYVAAPVVKDESIVAAVRLSLPNNEVEAVVQRTRVSLVLFVVAVIVAAGLIAWILAYSIAAPLRRVAEAADDLGFDLQRRAPESEGPGEVRSIASALNRTAERLVGLLRRQERVAEDASHHLRTPLTGVRLRLEAIEDVADQDQVRAEATAAIAEVDRLTRRIEQVLALARADAGDNLVRTDIAEIVDDRVQAFTAASRERDVELDVEIDDESGSVIAGEGAVARVIDELLGNALTYARQVIGVRVVREGSEVVVSVSDDGPGVSDEEYVSIFERFRRGSRAVPGGSGLGLALVRETARAAGGEAVARRSPLGGLEVMTRWPRIDSGAK